MGASVDGASVVTVSEDGGTSVIGGSVGGPDVGGSVVGGSDDGGPDDGGGPLEDGAVLVEPGEAVTITVVVEPAG